VSVELPLLSTPSHRSNESTPDLIGLRFERQVRSLSNKPAVCVPDRTTTYGEINASANQVANHLLNAPEGDFECVAFLLEHGADAVSAIIGILKAGKIVVPLDPSWPVDRLRWRLSGLARSL